MFVLTRSIVAMTKCLVVYRADPPGTLCDVLSCHFKVNPPWVTAHLIVHVKEGPQLSPDPIKVPCLEARFRLACVPVNRVGNPDNGLPLTLDSTDEAREVLPELVSTHAHDDRQLAWHILGIHGIDDAYELLGGALVRDLHPEWIANAAGELQVCAVEVAGALTDPEHVSGAVIPFAGGGVLAGESLLVRQQQTLVGRVEVHAGEPVSKAQ